MFQNASHCMDNCTDLDTQLLERCRQFDRQALADVYDTYSPALYCYAYRLLGDVNLAEECVAETFRRLLQALRDRRGPKSHLRAYLYRIAHNWITDIYRREHVLQVDLSEHFADGADLPEQLVDQRIRQERLRQVLRRLTPDQRQVIVLKFVEGCDNETVAAALNKPVGAIKSLQHRALQSLKRLLANEDVLR